MTKRLPWWQLLLLLVVASFGAQAQPWLTSPNPIAQYYKEKGWPAWTDKIYWNRRINMATYTNGANDFEKFENARDQLAAQGGGVLYYPAGTYNFADHPTGANAGRGLMLKKGVVILGEAPTSDDRAVVDSVTAGLTQLGTKFIFPFRQVPAVGGGFGEVPDPWNMIGLYADATERISDQYELGIAWVNLVGAYVYFGPDLDWSTTWGALGDLNDPNKSYRVARNSVYPGEPEAWNNRVTNGQHPGDPMFGAIKDGNYYKAKGGRFMFGCRLDHSAITDVYMENYKTVRNGTTNLLEKTDSVDANTVHTYRFAARVNFDGGDLFVANNALPQSDKNFHYDQKIMRHNMVVAGSPFQVKTILFDYGKQGGIDINKALITRAANRCNYINGPYAEENVVVRDNFVFSHGHKGFELAGKWMLVLNNYNSRIYLTEGDNIYNLPATGQSPLYELTLDGVAEAGVNSDNMSRAFDMAGWCAWIDGNWYQGTGSTPGNDGEGILYQTQGGVGFLSVAETFNRQGPTGKGGYIAPWDVPVYGMFQGWNRQRGSVGLLKPDANRVEDAVCIENYNPTNGQPSGTSGLTGSNIGDMSFTCPTGPVTPPVNVVVTPDTIKACIRITWDDAANNEVAFRIDRKVELTNDWVTVAYRPANVTGSEVTNWQMRDLGNSPAGCFHPGTMDLNPQEWLDFLAVPGNNYEYRVVALNCNNDDLGASPTTLPVTFPVVDTVSSVSGRLRAPLFANLAPNPATKEVLLTLNRPGAQAMIIDVHGRVLSMQVVDGLQTSFDVRHLAPGLYNVVVVQGDLRATRRFIKQ